MSASSPPTPIMRSLLAFLCAALAGATVALARPISAGPGAARADVDADLFTGNWATPGFGLTLEPAGDHYIGIATTSGHQYPVQSEVRDGVMTGIFSDERAVHIFQASVEGDLLQVAADGARLVLSRQTAAGAEAGAGPPPTAACGGMAGAPIGQNPNGRPVVEVDGRDPGSCP